MEVDGNEESVNGRGDFSENDPNSEKGGGDDC